MIRRRASRARYFNTQIFADPAWDILLDLGLARLEGTAPVYRAAAALPSASLARWLVLLTEEGLADREGDDFRMSDNGLASLDAWLNAR